MKQIGVITPSGSLGGGWNFADFRRCMDEEQIDVIAADSGSTDIGPYYLGTGTPFASRIEIKGELGELLRAAVEKGVPLGIGTARGARACRRGAQVIIAGRSCDDAVIASYPLSKGCSPALALHMGRILECGALAAEPGSLGIIMGFIGEDPFDPRPGDPRQRSTPKSVASHAFYEREDPIVHRGPGGTVDLSETTVEQLDARTARVRGSTYIPDRDYLVKIEGVRRVGYRTVCVAGVHDPGMIEKLDEILEMNRKVVEGYFKD